MKREDTRLVLELMERVEDLERRLNNIIRPGRVAKVDYDSGKVKVAYAKKTDGSDQLTPFIKWSERAGKTGSDEIGIKTWMPLVVGEQVFIVSPGGDIGLHSWCMPGGYSDAADAPHSAGGEPMILIGDTKITLSGETVKCETKHVAFEVENDVTFNVGGTKITADTGKVKIEADEIDLKGSQKISLDTAQLSVKASAALWDIDGKISEWSGGHMQWRAASVDWQLG